MTCEYPPAVGGVSDHTRALASALTARGERVHVWAGIPIEGSDAAADPTVHFTLGRFTAADCRRTGRLMDQHPSPRRLFVQWVPHGYGFKGMNVWMAAWLAGRAWLRGDEVHVMIHEPYMELSPRPAETAVALVQRMMLAMVCWRAAHVWLSIPAWAVRLRRYVPARVPMSWLPVPACAVPAPDAPVIHAIRQRTASNGAPLVGHFSTYAPPVRPFLERVLDDVMNRSSAHALLVGRGSEQFRDRFIATRPGLAARVHAMGVLNDADLAAHVAACDLFVQPYPDGISARRTSALLPLSLGRAIVSNTGRLTEPFWAESGAVALAESPDAAAVAERAVALLTDAAEQARLGARASTLYDQRFDVRHAVTQLQAA